MAIKHISYPYSLCDRWNLRPSNKNAGNYRPKDGEENGSRIYQMMLNLMQVLPVADILQMALLDNRIIDVGSKGKCKAARVQHR